MIFSMRSAGRLRVQRAALSAQITVCTLRASIHAGLSGLRESAAGQLLHYPQEQASMRVSGV